MYIYISIYLSLSLLLLSPPNRNQPRERARCLETNRRPLRPFIKACAWREKPSTISGWSRISGDSEGLISNIDADVRLKSLKTYGDLLGNQQQSICFFPWNSWASTWNYPNYNAEETNWPTCQQRMKDSAIGKCIGNDEEGIGSSRKKYVLRVISTLNQYSDIVSDIPSGSIYGIFILTFCLTISDILSGKYSDIVSGISSGIYSGILSGTFWHMFWHSFSHSIWYIFGDSL